jgi:hypothetical protein
LRKTTKWGTDVSLRVLRVYAIARFGGFFCDIFVRRFPHKMGATFGPVLYSARFACSGNAHFWMISPSTMNKRRWLSGFLRIPEHFYSLENTISQVLSQNC